MQLENPILSYPSLRDKHMQIIACKFICMYYVTTSVCSYQEATHLPTRGRSIKKDEWEGNIAHDLKVEEGILGGWGFP